MSLSRRGTALTALAALAALAVLAVLPACGDNSAACGDGTMLNGSGYCVPAGPCGTGTVLDPSTNQCVPDGTIVCAAGTVFDPATGTCQVDTSTCQGGTVLVGGRCVDPTAGLTIDLEEAPEPNGLGYVEASAAPAGTIAALPAVGAASYVIHGHLDPWRDADGDGQTDPDVDTYLVSVDAPALLRVAVTGLHGVTAGFLAGAQVAAGDPLAAWRRFGMNVTGATSTRTVLLPRAGTYALAIADTRTLFPLATGGGPLGAAPGGPDGDYYVSIDQLSIPAPTPITVTGGTGTQAGTTSGDIQIFSAPMGTGFNQVQLAIAAPQAQAAAVVLDAGGLRGAGQAPAASGTATAYAGGFATGEAPWIAVDDVYDTAAQPVAFELTVHDTDATALSKSGGTASQPELSANPASIGELNAFYYDVSNADESVSFDLHASTAVDGMIVGPDQSVLAPLTAAGGFVGDTFQDYAGLVRHPRPGRYYLVIYDPAHGGTGTLSVTSTVTEEAETPIPLGLPSGQQMGTATLPFSFDSTGSPWDVFFTSGTNVGGVAVAFYDPATTYGRLAPLAVTCSGRGACPAGPATLPPDATSLFAYDFPAAGASHGRILLDQPTQQFFVTATAAQPGTFTFAFAARPVEDLGAMPAGTSGTVTGEKIDTTTPVHYYLVESDPGNGLAITVTPGATLDTSIQLVGEDESPLGAAANDGAAGQPDHASATMPAGAAPYVAWTVSGTPTSSTAQPFDVTAAVSAP